VFLRSCKSKQQRRKRWNTVVGILCKSQEGRNCGCARERRVREYEVTDFCDGDLMPDRPPGAALDRAARRPTPLEAYH
jgi:hypothetical protein